MTLDCAGVPEVFAAPFSYSCLVSMRSHCTVAAHSLGSHGHVVSVTCLRILPACRAATHPCLYDVLSFECASDRLVVWVRLLSCAWCLWLLVQVSPELRDLICQLLDKDAVKRLGVQGALQVSTLAAPWACSLTSSLGLRVARAKPQQLLRMLQVVWYGRFCDMCNGVCAAHSMTGCWRWPLL